MADSRSSTRPGRSNKSCIHFLSKFIFFALFLIAIPLFPSQAPDFINHQTLLTKFWELIHLLFIGIAVSYGLFSRRNVDMDFEIQPNLDDSLSNASRIFHVSSIFEDGYENLSGSDEKNVYQISNSQHYEDESVVGVNNGSSVIKEQSKLRSLNLENGFENLSGYDEKNVAQTWNSQYFQGESMVVMAQPNYARDECGKQGSKMGYEPLGLPVRSLRSRVRNPDSPEFINGSGSGSSAKDSSKSSEESKNGNFGDLSPTNLEEKFNESIASASPIPWRSRSGRMEMRQNVGSAARSSHFRPLSVDETQFESLKSRSFQSTVSFSSQTNSMSHSPSRLSPSHSSSSDLSDTKMEELGKEKSSRWSYPLGSPSQPAPMNVKPQLNASHSRQYGNSSLFDKDVPRSFNDDLKNLDVRRRDDSLGSKELGSGSLKWDSKPATPVNGSSRGKSVRTIRTSGYVSEAMEFGDGCGNGVNDKVGNNKIEAVDMGKNELKSNGLDDISSGTAKQNVMSKPTFSEHENRGKQASSENFDVESEEDYESEDENFQVSSDEDVVTDSVSDAGPDPNEVDMRAGEFIAKFREQIRLQKEASMRKSKGVNLKGNYFR